VELIEGEIMKNIVCIFVATTLLIFCAGKSTNADGKKNSKPVISAFEEAPATEVKQESKAAADVLDSPRFVPSTTESSPEAVVDKNSPKEVIKNYTAELQTLQDDPVSKSNKREKVISEKVRKFFDFEGLSRESLGPSWNQLTPKKQKEFVSIFTGLIEKSYLRRSKNLVGNYQVSYGNEKITAGIATVACEIYKDDVDVEIVYELHKVSGIWMIYNIIFDQVNLVKNYQSQFNQIISKSGVNGLMDVMRKKLKENSSDIDNAI
jgi:phospholipid transport system substrate-binding protein